MADRYWVGGAGTWDATTTTNWATSTGGAGGASAPTSADNVIFDTLSNATLYTVTVGTDAVCNDLTADGALVGNVTFSLAATVNLDCFGSFTLAATGITWAGTGGCTLSFKSTSTGKTVTTNGISLTSTRLDFDGVGGAWTLGSALTFGNNQGLFVQNGTFNTGNFNITGNALARNIAGTATINLGSSTLTLSGATSVNFNETSGLTFNAGTSTITCSNASPTFTGGGLTYYNVSFTSAANGSSIINGANTFNDLTQTSRSATGRRLMTLGADQTVLGTLTLGAANQSVRRTQVQSDIIGTRRTITLNGTLATLADVDFKDIGAAGTVATPWTGTRIGNGLNNNNITFDAAKDVYWNLAAGGNWSATAWATTSGGTPNADNFPLSQDKAIIENTGLNTSATISIETGWWIGELDFSTRSNAMTFANAGQVPSIYKNVTLSSAVTMTGTNAWNFIGQGTTQILDTNTATFVPPITIDSPSGTLQLAENTTCSASVTLTRGTLDLNDFDLTCNVFSSTNSNTRSIDFGTGDINLTGNAATILSMGTVTGFTYSGTPTVNATYSGSTGTRAINCGVTGVTESNALNLNITAGTDTVALSTNQSIKNLNFTGFTGTLSSSNRVLFGNLTLGTGMTSTNGTGVTTFASTLVQQNITSNGVVLGSPITCSGTQTVQLQDNLTMGSTRAFTLTSGTLDLDGKTLTVGSVSTSNSNTRSIDFGVNGLINCEGAFTATNSTGLTTAGRGRIKMSSASAKTFAGGGANYAGVALEQAGAGTLTITGANTFDDITNSNATASQITFPASTTTSVRKLSVSGSSGNLVSLRSSTEGTAFTIQTV